MTLENAKFMFDGPSTINFYGNRNSPIRKNPEFLELEKEFDRLFYQRDVNRTICSDAEIKDLVQKLNSFVDKNK